MSADAEPEGDPDVEVKSMLQRNMDGCLAIFPSSGRAFAFEVAEAFHGFVAVPSPLHVVWVLLSPFRGGE